MRVQNRLTSLNKVDCNYIEQTQELSALYVEQGISDAID